MKPKEQNKPGPGKFNTNYPFPHDLPYQEYYAEKVPLLTAFRMALGNFLMGKSATTSLASRISHVAAPLFDHEEFAAAECGVYKGNSLIACAEIARDAGLNCRFYGLDTFCGLPPLSQADRDLAPPNASYLERTAFDDTSVEEVTQKLQERGLDGFVTLLPGLFQDTLPQLSDKKFWFVSIDCDLYEPHLECLRFFYPRMERGGLMFFDDYHSIEYPMARAAIGQFLSDKSEKLFHLRYGDDKPNHLKSYIVKH